MSTDKPFRNYRHKENGECTNHLRQEFNQKRPNIVWASDFTYIKVSGKWYFLCIVMDLFSRKVISWNISSKPDVDLVMTAFKKAYEKRNHPEGLINPRCTILKQFCKIIHRLAARRNNFNHPIWSTITPLISNFIFVTSEYFNLYILYLHIHII